MSLNPYETLGVDSSATDAEIKAAYRVKAQQTHPDKNPDDPFAKTRFELVNEAYSILKDGARRRAFDANTTDTVKRQREQAMNLLMQALMGVMQVVGEMDDYELDKVDLVTSIIQTISSTESGGEIEWTGSKKRLKNLRKLVKRYRFSGKGTDFMTDILTSKIQEEERNEKEIVATLASLKYARAIMDDYKDLPPEEAMRRISSYNLGVASRDTTFSWIGGDVT